jgi:CubicO group peptidase (beta-lactamase class C family)
MTHPFANHCFIASMRKFNLQFAQRCIAPLALVTATLAGCAHTDAGKPDATLAARVDAVITPLVEAHEFSGAVVLTRRGQVVYQRGFGMANHAAGTAFTSDTASDGASLAKTFTAAGIWWLANEKRIDLDAPVQRYLAEFPHAQTTVRQLISHTNGLPANYEFFDAHFKPDEVRTTQAMLGVVAKHAPLPSFPPGHRFEYSSIGFDVGALLIERVSGLRYEDFLKQRFFSPLGMSTSFTRTPRLADWPGVRTMGYRWRDGAWVPFDVFDMEAFRGGSNLYFSANDLSRWASAHASGAGLPAAVFSAGLRRTEVAGQRAGLTGLNWYCDDANNRCYYTGDLNAFYSVAYWDRARDESVVFVSNSNLPAWRRATLARELTDALAEKPAQPRSVVTFERFSNETRAAIAGTYIAKDVGHVKVSVGKQGLRIRVADGPEYELFPVSREVVYCPGLDLWLAFSGGSPPSTLHISSLFVDSVLQRAP